MAADVDDDDAGAWGDDVDIMIDDVSCFRMSFKFKKSFQFNIICLMYFNNLSFMDRRNDKS